ncbi:MAG TPA: amino acid permease C-terminal domain-containing protein, partial [Bacteroidia bacterium]|nr:amino acid permease C-terminal domain-containing protein [Bacteroidia bacterium]
GISGVIAIAGVLLVYQMGQPRIWMSMSRDGLLPAKFGKIHPKYKTPAFATIITGIVVAVPSLFLDIGSVTDLTSVGTLFAFVLVCAGVLQLDQQEKTDSSRYRVPYVNGKFWLPLFLVTVSILLYIYNHAAVIDFFSMPVEKIVDGETISVQSQLFARIPMVIYIITCIYLAYRTIIKSLSLIPVLGLLLNLYLMTELGATNWLRFVIWLAIGLVIYFGYSYYNSKLGRVDA